MFIKVINNLINTDHVLYIYDMVDNVTKYDHGEKVHRLHFVMNNDENLSFEIRESEIELIMDSLHNIVKPIKLELNKV